MGGVAVLGVSRPAGSEGPAATLKMAAESATSRMERGERPTPRGIGINVGISVNRLGNACDWWVETSQG